MDRVLLCEVRRQRGSHTGAADAGVEYWLPNLPHLVGDAEQVSDVVEMNAEDVDHCHISHVSVAWEPLGLLAGGYRRIRPIADINR